MVAPPVALGVYRKAVTPGVARATLMEINKDLTKQRPPTSPSMWSRRLKATEASAMRRAWRRSTTCFHPPLPGRQGRPARLNGDSRWRRCRWRMTMARAKWCEKHGYPGYTSYASLNDLPWRFPEFAGW